MVALLAWALMGTVSDTLGERQQLSLDTGWKAVKLGQALITEDPPADDADWANHDMTGLPLPAKVGEVCQAWYRCNVRLPTGFADDSIWLRLTNWRAARVACWINGTRLEEEYWTGSLPVEWRVGDHLREGADNQIVLAFWSVDWAKVVIADDKADDSEAH
jgi:hypothetical protein